MSINIQGYLIDYEYFNNLNENGIVQERV